jgi:hypothetical protein
MEPHQPPLAADKTVRVYAYSALPSEIARGDLSYVKKVMDKRAVILVHLIMVWVWEVVSIWREKSVLSVAIRCLVTSHKLDYCFSCFLMQRYE